MAEVLVPMGAFKAFAATDLIVGRLFKWHTTEEYVGYTSSGQRPVGVVIEGSAVDDSDNEIIPAGEILNAKGASEWFKSGGIIKVRVAFNADVGDLVMSGADGTIVEAVVNGTNYVFGQVLTAALSGEEAEIFVY